MQVDTPSADGAVLDRSVPRWPHMSLTRPAPAIPLAETRWRLWPQALVRSAGFPAANALGLSDRTLSEAADRVPEPRRYSRPDLTEVDPLWQRYWRRADRLLLDIGTAPWFRLAVTWQNRSALRGSIDALLEQIAVGGPRSARRRARETNMVMYLQRYCLKNETIGFYGPVAFAGIDPGLPVPFIATPGLQLLSGVDVHLEGWAVDAVADRLARDHDLRPWLAPRRVPSLRLDPDGLRFPNGRVEPVDAVTAAVLARVDGRTPAREVAETVAAEHGLSSADEVMALLSGLVAERRLRWDLTLSGPLYLDDELAALADRITDPAVAWPLRADLARLAEAKRRITSVWDDHESLEKALADLDDTFIDLSGVDATRRHGEAYSGRTVAYPESRRDVRVDLGAPFLDALSPLAPLADSARWLSWRVRDLFVPHVEAAYRRLVDKGVAEPNAMALWLECLPLLLSGLPEALEAAKAEFHEKWRRVLAADPQAHLVHRSLGEIVPAVATEFGAPRAGWSEARICCPDVMLIGGAGPGDPLLVLGELHLSLNSIDYQCLAPQHPDMSVLTGMLAADFPGPRLLKALPKDNRPRLTPRSHPALIRDTDFRLVLSPNHPTPAAGTPVAAADVRVLDRPGGLTLQMPDGSRFDVMELFSEQVKEPMAQAFTLLPGERRPRIVVDRMVVARRSWMVRARSAEFAAVLDERDRFVAARLWVRRQGMPRRVFVKSPLETKPFFVDFESPPYVEILSRTIRRLVKQTGEGADTAGFTVSEMSPEPEQNWLTDAEGRQYTSELRLVLVERSETDGAGT